MWNSLGTVTTPVNFTQLTLIDGRPFARRDSVYLELDLTQTHGFSSAIGLINPLLPSQICGFWAEFRDSATESETPLVIFRCCSVRAARSIDQKGRSGENSLAGRQHCSILEHLSINTTLNSPNPSSSPCNISYLQLLADGTDLA